MISYQILLRNSSIFLDTGHALCNSCSRNFLRYCSQKRSKELIRLDYFQQVKDKNKGSYLEMVNIYKEKEKLRRGHVEFIYSALRHMKEFGVEKDLQVYKSLIDIFPKGKMIPKNIFQVEFMHYPKHQQCAIDLLEQMEENAVMPDWEMEDQLMNVFGSKGHPLRRYWRMMYWLPKFKNASPWQLPRPVPSDSLELAKLGIERITGVDSCTVITVYKTSDVPDSVDDTWIVSGQSSDQNDIINEISEGSSLFVEGPFRLWLRNQQISYFILRSNPLLPPEEDTDADDVSNLEVGILAPAPVKRKRSVHDQEGGCILACCATGTSSPDSLLSWIRCLEVTNPHLSHLQVLFSIGKGSEKEEEQELLSAPTERLTAKDKET